MRALRIAADASPEVSRPLPRRVDAPEAGPAAAPEGPPEPGALTLIGTGHVFDIQSTVRGAILALRPDVVFVELDRGRLQALAYRRQHGHDPPSRGGFVHKRLQGFQQNVAQMYGSEVGAEMLAAVDAGQAVGARVLLIDPPVERTLKRALSQLTLREKARAAGLLVRSGLQNLLPRRRDGREDVEAEIRRYQEDPAAALDELGRTFPTVRRVLIDERDEVMATRIRAGLAGARHGVAVLGDGHLPGILARLADLEPEAYRLAAVRAGELPVPEGTVATGDGVDVSFGFAARTGPPQGL